jgi:serine/threonine protein kinase
LGIYQDEKSDFYLVMEYCKLGSLDRWISESDISKHLSAQDRIKMCLNVAAGCRFLEQKNIIHRDLGARNLLVSELDHSYVVKVGI